MKHKLIDILNGYFNPRYWVMIYPYNKEWDLKFNKYLDSFDFSIESRCIGKIGDVDVWISNYPYAIFDYRAHGITVRPSRATISKAYRKLTSQLGMSIDNYLIKQSLK